MLARWNHLRRGTIPPSEFIPVIEHLGLVGGLHLEHPATRVPRREELAGRTAALASTCLRSSWDLTFPARLLGVLHETGFSPKRLEIEITETALMSDLETVKAVLAALQNLGVKIALDDFGTGYSSLYHLRELKLDKIKIDRSFIQSISEDSGKRQDRQRHPRPGEEPEPADDRRGHRGQRDLSRRMHALGCDIGQGYYFGKAMPAEDATAFIRKVGRDELARSPEVG